MEFQPIFLSGLGRSGTTLLRQMINSHSQIAVPYESHFITKYTPIIESLGKEASKADILNVLEQICSEEILKYWDYYPNANAVFDSLQSFTPADVFNTFYMLYAKHHGKVRWGDKSAYLSNLYDIKKIFPNAVFIHIVRDGRDVANSFKNMDFGPKTIADTADFWDRYVKLGMSMGRMLPSEQYMELRYEDLVTQTEVELKRICEFIGVEFEPTMLEYYKDAKKYIPQNLLKTHYNADKPPNPDRVYSWKKKMPQVELDIFNQIAKDMLNEFNYEIPPIKSSSMAIKLKKLKDLLFKKAGKPKSN